jgi:ABC-type lipoprotein export system ATPase subunit
MSERCLSEPVQAAPALGGVMIAIRGLQKSYFNGAERVPILKGIDLDISQGESVSIVGTSGSGKTTLLNLLGGLDTEYEGSITIAGREMRALGDLELASFRNQTIGYVFQAFNLLEHLSCAENVMLPAAFVRGALSFDPEQRAREVLEKVGLPHKHDEKPTALSGGQRQRVAVARALFLRPSMLLCDEPTGSLDRTTGEQILGLFTELHREEKITLLLITHEEHIAQATERVLRIEAGRITADERRAPKKAENEPR